MLIGYARASTLDQSLDLQTDALMAAGCSKIFEERASGAQRDRPALREALEYARNGQGDVLVVWRLDRLARSLGQLIQTVEGLSKRGIGFRSLTETIDTTTAGGKLVLHIFGAMAEFERQIMQERTQAGLQAARARGRVGGRPPALKAADMAKVRAMLSDPSITVEQVAEQMKVAPSTLYRHLPGGRGSL